MHNTSTLKKLVVRNEVDPNEMLALSPEDIIANTTLVTHLSNLENNNRTHLIVASFEWDTLMILLDSPTDIRLYPEFVNKFKTVKLIADDTVLRSSLKFVTDLFPEKASLIRKAHIKRESILEIIG